jgi:acetyl esterase/lipase
LATTAATHHTHGDAMAEDRVEHHPSAPSFLIAIYPVVTLTPPHAHMGSRHNLLGHEASEATVASLCNATQVTPTTPPTFLVHTWEDTAVPAENSIEFYLALRKAGVRAEMHLYEQGHHGFGMAIDRRGPPWTPALEAWMRVHGWMK